MPKERKPRRSRGNEIIAGSAAHGRPDNWYGHAAAAEYLAISVRRLKALDLSYESQGRARFYRQSVLDGYRDQAAATAGIASRRSEVASRTHSVHPRWLDEDGVSRAFSVHPNYYVVREVMRRVEPELVCEEWRGHHVAFVYGVAAEIGMQPSKHHRLEVIEPGQVLGPSTVLWWHRPWARTARAMAALRRKAESGDVVAQVVWAGRLQPSGCGLDAAAQAARLSDRRREAAWQRAEQRGDYPCDCTRIYECDAHAAARRAGDDDVDYDDLDG